MNIFSFLPFLRNSVSEQEVFFIRGFNRSGTNWLSNLISLHPDISVNGEFHLQQLDIQFVHFLKTAKWNFFLKKPEHKQKFLNLYYNFIRDTIKLYNPNTPLVGDRTPSRIDQLIVPNSKYIIISRDGRDAIVSWFYHILNTKVPDINEYSELQKNLVEFVKNSNYFEENPDQLLNCEKYFRQRARFWNNQILRDKKTCEEVDNGKINIKYLWVKYESLHMDVEGERNRIFKFLNVQPKKAKPINEKTSPGFKIHNPKSHYRLGAVNNWVKYFTPEYAEWFDQEAGEALKVLGLPLTTEVFENHLASN